MGAADISFADPSMMGDGSPEDMLDPQRRLMRMMSMAAMKNLSGGQGQGQGQGSGADTSGAPPSRDVLATMSGDDAAAAGMIPAGFDESTGMPTEYPATADKTAASDRLQRANSALYPQTTKGRLIRAATTMAPAAIGLIGGGGAAGAGAATGALEGAKNLQQLRLGERSNVQQMYQFEAGREERERDQAIRERVAMAQISAQKAYRTLMASIAGRREANQETNTEVNAQGRSLTVVKAADGTSKVVRLDPDQLSTLNQARLGVEQATQKLSDARAKAIPEQIEIAKKHLEIQQQQLQVALQRLSLSEDRLQLATRSEDYKETGPTAASKNMGQMAATVPSHIKSMRDQVQEAADRGYIGPMAGRVYSDFLAGKVGSTGDPEADKFLGDMRTNAKLLTSAMLRTHFGGRGISLYGSFEGMLAAKRSSAELAGTLDEFDKYISSYSGMTKWEGGQEWGSLRPGQRQGAASKLKKGPASSSGANPPAGARIRDYTQLGAGNGASR